MELEQLFEEVLIDSLREMDLHKIGDKWLLILPDSRKYEYSDEDTVFKKAREILDSGKCNTIKIERVLQDGSLDPDATKILRNP